MSKRLHLIGIFHTIHNQEHSHCAFTGKALRFAKMMQPLGYDVIEYANEGSESEAVEKVQMLSLSQHAELKEAGGVSSEFHGNHAVCGSPLHNAFDNRLRAELSMRLRHGDIVCHPFGNAHTEVVRLFSHNSHVETGIGYPTIIEGTFKIYESEAWRSYHLGKANKTGSHYEWVIPNYFDLNEWQVQLKPKNYIAFMGRICQDKGLDTVLEIARRVDVPVVICGQGDPSHWLKHPNIHFAGHLKGAERSEFIGNALCSLMPTKFFEPFGGSGVEGMLCGTPLVSVDFAAFTETVTPGVTGYRCKTLRQWLDAIEACKSIDRAKVAETARSTYSLEACGKRYDEVFNMIHDLSLGGWYKDCDIPKSRALEIPQEVVHQKCGASS